MTAGAALRPLVLAGVALLAVVGALATRHRVDPPSTAPAAVDAAGASRRLALVVPLVAGRLPTGCSFVLAAGTLAVTQPVLPCGTRVELVGTGGRVATAQVAGHGPLPDGATFGLTPALARALDVTGPVAMTWSLAR